MSYIKLYMGELKHLLVSFMFYSIYSSSLHDVGKLLAEGKVMKSLTPSERYSILTKHFKADDKTVYPKTYMNGCYRPRAIDTSIQSGYSDIPGLCTQNMKMVRTAYPVSCSTRKKTLVILCINHLQSGQNYRQHSKAMNKINTTVMP